MSSSTVGMPTDSALSRLSASVSPALSASGMKIPSTFCGPNARAASAAQTLESIPPERATTAPRLRSRRRTVSFSCSTTSSTTASASMSRLAGVTSALRVAIEFRRHEATDSRNGVEVIRKDFLVGNLDVEIRLEILDQFEHAGGVDDAGLDQGVVAAEVGALVGEREVQRQEVPDVAFD